MLDQTLSTLRLWGQIRENGLPFFRPVPLGSPRAPGVLCLGTEMRSVERLLVTMHMLQIYPLPERIDPCAEPRFRKLRWYVIPVLLPGS